ncbi:MAG: hypothetical protein Q9227_006360 [Pyrenula ochraceoflavens]
MAGPDKRKLGNFIDLTEDNENEPPTKSSKSAIANNPASAGKRRAPLSSQSSWNDSGYSSSPSHGLSQHSQSERDSWLAASTQELDANALENVPSTNDDENEDSETYELYGNIDTKIVGVRYYNGRVTQGEYALVKREPGNVYDRNAIRIDNVMNNQIGHINRNMAAKLAPFLDCRDLVAEAVLTGEKGYYDCPIRLKLFGTSDPAAQAALKEKMQAARLPVNELIKAERERRRQEKEREKAMKAAKKVMGMKGGSKAGSSQENAPDQAEFANLSVPGPSDNPVNMDDIMGAAQNFDPRAIGQVVDNFSGGEDDLAALPMADQPMNLKTALLPYQRQGLQWMLERESPQLPTRGSKDTTQLWKHDQNGCYTNIATNFTTKQAPKLASGGILADDMGLGKTIQVISLIDAADPNRTQQPTLIVSPLSVMSNWRDQAEAHMNENSPLRTLIYHGPSRDARSPQDFAQYNLVITTYQTLAQEYMPSGKKSPAPIPRKEGLYSMNWRRLVLDEGHNIRNPKAKMAVAACAVEAASRWILTGTPIVNSLKDLHSHIKFLRLTGGLEKAEVFNAALMRPLRSGLATSAASLLRALIATICLRRLKDMKFVDLRLPELTSHKYPVKFLKHEQEKYDAFKSEAQGLLLEYQNKRQQKGEKAFSHLLEVLLRLRQTCNHWVLAKDRLQKLMEVLEENKIVALTPENKLALQSLLQVRIESQEECSICLDLLHCPVITACGHSFGQQCIERVIEANHKCPLCRAELKDTDSALVFPSNLGEDEGATDIDPDTSSSKIEALIKILRASAGKAGTKTVVFSQWTSFLDLIEPHLQKHGLAYCRLDGTMNAASRDHAIKSISVDPSCTVMLASLTVCSVGLNLASANQVILADSWWAPAIEDQAVDRVHRLGQTKPVTVFRLVMEGSIEERVLEIQAKKRELTNVAFGEGTSGRRKRGEEKVGRLRDIEMLLRSGK